MPDFLREILVGGLAGAVEVTCMNPTIAVKNAVQEGRALSASPATLYRGYTVNLAMCVPITACFFGSNAGFSALFTNTVGRRPRGAEGVVCAAMAGATSAVVAGPAELVVIQQQRAGLSAGEAFRKVIAGYGLPGLFKGSLCTAARDGVVLAGLLGLAPVITAELKQRDTTQSWSRNSQLLSASLASGLLGTAASMPFDAAKTLQQAHLDKQTRPEYASIRSTLADIYARGGVTALYSGSLPRGFRIVCATFILNSVKEWAQDLIDGFTVSK